LHESCDDMSLRPNRGGSCHASETLCALIGQHLGLRTLKASTPPNPPTFLHHPLLACNSSESAHRPSTNYFQFVWSSSDPYEDFLTRMISGTLDSTLIAGLSEGHLPGTTHSGGHQHLTASECFINSNHLKETFYHPSTSISTQALATGRSKRFSAHKHHSPALPKVCLPANISTSQRNNPVPKKDPVSIPNNNHHN
jgi:hypothetical protein